jgi:hypothetical protein
MRTRGDCESVLNQDDRGRRKKTELAMIHEAEGPKQLMKKTQSKELGDETEIDSVDSLICACGTHMFMRFLHSRTEKEKKKPKKKPKHK